MCGLNAVYSRFSFAFILYLVLLSCRLTLYLAACRLFVA